MQRKKQHSPAGARPWAAVLVAGALALVLALYGCDDCDAIPLGHGDLVFVPTICRALPEKSRGPLWLAAPCGVLCAGAQPPARSRPVVLSRDGKSCSDWRRAAAAPT